MASVADAIKFARRAHAGQKRDDGVTDYIEHPLAVMQILKDFGYGYDLLLIVAVLHDVIEDSSTTHEELVKEFGKAVADVVLELTDKKREKKASYHELAAEKAGGFIFMSNIAKAVKLADRLHNVRTMHDSWPDWKIKRYVKATDLLLSKAGSVVLDLQIAISGELMKRRA